MYNPRGVSSPHSCIVSGNPKTPHRPEGAGTARFESNRGSVALPLRRLPHFVLSEREMERGRGCRKQAKQEPLPFSLACGLGASSTGARVADARRGADRNAELPFS